MNQKGGRRWSATNAWLRPVMGRPNLTVMTETVATKIRVEQKDGAKRATGIEIRTAQGATQFIAARKAVVLAAGSIASPQLLQLSGIGPGDLLQKFGIPVVHEMAGVGANLHDHLQVRLVYKVQGVTTLNERVNSLWGKLSMGLEYLFRKTGPLTMPPSQLGAFARSDPAQPSANIEWHVQPLSLDKFGEPLHSFPAITPSVCNLRPTSRGHVRITSTDPAAEPEILLNYLSTPEDQKVAVDSMRFTRRIMKAQALAKYRPEEWKPGAPVESDAQLLKAAGDLGTTIFHPVSTCRMGNDVASVVDERLRVHGIAGLRVIDASIMPRITSGNTNAPVYVIAELGARMLIEDDRRA
jgi:choline dehydrogenase